GAEAVLLETLTLPTEIERTRCDQCGRFLPEKDGLCPFCIRKWDTLKRIIGFLAPYRWGVIILMLSSALITGLELIPPILVAHIIDDVLVPAGSPGSPGSEVVAPVGLGAVELLGTLVLGLLAVRLLSWGINLVNGFVRADLAAWTGRDIRSRLYGNLQFLPLRFYDRRKVGSLISRFLNDSDRLEMFLLFGVPYVLSNLLMLVGVLGLLLYLNWELTLYVLAPVPLIVAASLRQWRQLVRYWTRWHAKWSRLSTHLTESINGIRVVKAFAQERREEERFRTRNDDLRQASVSAERVWFIFYAVMNFLMSFGVFLVWYFGGRQILRETLTIGALMAFVSYIWQLYQPLQFFSQVNNFITRAFAGAERVFEVIDARPEPFTDPRAVPLPVVEGRVSFRGVAFGYDPAKPVLKEVDLEVKPGEMIGLVGRSGVGKTTLVNLVCRFYEANRGILEIDGIDIRRIRLEDLRRQIGMVAQESFLFNGSILENIRYGKPEAPLEEVFRAARAANAHEFIVQKPDGYDTLVGESGGRLSGGEKQRIAIARAILRDPRILILDEATSSVDTPTEKKLQEAIRRLVQGRTTFAIAHRLSTLRHADRLVVIDEGRIAEMGTHAELMAREGIFYKLVRTQQESSAVMAVGGGRGQPA
ncbi:MAG: ABC transporter ATP-binding protein, partial [Candidatus Latescibacterota bacterium]